MDVIWHKRRFVIYFAIGRKTKLILNYHIDYRDVIKFLQGIPEEIRYSDKITFVSDAYYVENCVIVNKKELKKRKNKELREGLGEVNRIERFFATLRCWFAQLARKSLKIIKSLNTLKIKLDLFTYFWNMGIIS